MSGPQKPGTLGNLTADEEKKLQETWVHLLRLCGAENVGTDALSSIPDKSAEFQQYLDDKSPEGFKKNFWYSIRAEHPDGVVLRFLRARKFDVEKSVIMMLSAINWRHQRKIDTELIFEGESVGLKENPTADDQGFIAQYRSGKSFVRGTDMGNRPVYIIRVRLHDPSLQTPEAMETYILHNIESLRVLVKAPYDEACLIFDMTGFGLKNMDFHVVKFLVQVFEARYPETLGLVLIHNAPFVFWGIWSIIKGWLDPVIASKINFTRSTSDMAKFITKENMQKAYGGQDTWEYKYVEPVPGENDKLQLGEKRAVIQDERTELAEEFVRQTVDWAALDPESDAAKENASKRDDLVTKLQTNYWKLDPYIRSKTYLHRVGVVDGEGNVDFRGAGRVK